MQRPPLRQPPVTPSEQQYYSGTPAGQLTRRDPSPNGGFDGLSSAAVGTPGFETALDAHGVSTSAVQVGILKGKVRAQEQEVARLKNELREAAEKAAAVSTRLTDEKMQTGSLTHKYSVVVQKLSAAETAQKQLEDALLVEQRSHQAAREGLERARQQQRHKDEMNAQQTRQLEDRVAAMTAQQQAHLGVGARGTEQHTRDMNDLTAKAAREYENLATHYRDTVERLVDLKEEDEAALFVARSACQSTATELEGKLDNVQAQHEVALELLASFMRDTEEEAGRMTMTLMQENKELWAASSRLQFDLDQARSEAAAEKRRAEGGGPFKEQLEFTRQQLAAAEEKLAQCREAMDQQTAVERGHEDRMRNVVEQLRAAEARADALQEERDTAAAAAADSSRRFDEAMREAQQRGQDHAEATRQVQTLKRQVDTMTETQRTERERAQLDNRNALAQAKGERDAAESSRLQTESTLEDARDRIKALERELVSLQAANDAFKASMDETHQAYQRTLHEELSQHKNLYEKEIEQIRSDGHRAATDADRARRELDEAQAEAQAQRARAQGLEDALQDLQREATAGTTERQRGDERVRLALAERDTAKVALSDAESREADAAATVEQLRLQLQQQDDAVQHERSRYEQQLTAAEQHYREAEKQRVTVVEELRRVKLKPVDDQTLKALREKMEQDREAMQRENDRLQKAFTESQAKVAHLQSQATQLRSRAGDVGALQRDLEEAQRTCGEVPVLQRAVEDGQRENARQAADLRNLKQERDELAAKVDFFLEESRLAARKGIGLDRLFHEASEHVRRLDRQIEEVNTTVRGAPSLSAQRHPSPVAMRPAPAPPQY